MPLSAKKIKRRLKKAGPAAVVEIIWIDACSWGAGRWIDLDDMPAEGQQCLSVGMLKGFSDEAVVIVQTLSLEHDGINGASIPLGWIEKLRVLS